MSIGFQIKLTLVDPVHVRDLQTLADNESSNPWATLGGLHVGREAQAYVDRAQRLRARGLGATFAVCAGSTVVGLVVLARWPGTPEQAELGYWIGRMYRGGGHGTAAVAQTLTHAFTRMRLAVVVARSDAGNRASTRLLERLAFSFVGLEPAQGPTALRRYELTREAWARATSSSPRSAPPHA